MSLDVQTQLPIKITDGSNTVAIVGTALSVTGTNFTGSLSNNNAAPGSTNFGVLPALANAAAPSYTEGNQVLLSTNLSGALRITGTVTANAGTGTYTVTPGGTFTVDTELPAAAVPTEGSVTPSVPGVTDYMQMYDPATSHWNFVRGDTTNGLWVNVKAGSITVVPSGTQTVSVANTVTVDTELPAAAAMVENLTSPTVPQIADFPYMYDPSTTHWNFVRGDTTNGLWVNIKAGTVTTVPSGTQTVTGTIAITGGTISTNESSTGVVVAAQTLTNVAHTATAVGTYTITTGKTLYLKQLIASASGGPAKVQIDSSTTTIGVGFNSTANPNMGWVFGQPIPLPQATYSVVNVRMTNTAGQAQDMYFTIIGHEV